MADRKSIIAPSVLAADFAELGTALRTAEEAGADWIHLDVMDGRFVPPITFGAQMVASIRKRTNLPLDSHLMIVEPAQQLDAFIEAGTDRLTFHIEAEVHAHRLLSVIKEKGVKAGISIVPSTPITAIMELLGIVDQILVMTVNPGYGGQTLIPSTLDKIRHLADLRDQGAGDYLIAMDGGFGPETAGQVWDSGVDIAVMGSAFFGAENPKNAIKNCRPENR